MKLIIADTDEDRRAILALVAGTSLVAEAAVDTLMKIGSNPFAVADGQPDYDDEDDTDADDAAESLIDSAPGPDPEESLDCRLDALTPASREMYEFMVTPTKRLVHTSALVKHFRFNGSSSVAHRMNPLLIAGLVNRVRPGFYEAL